MPADVDLDVEVAGRAAAGADLALAGQLDARALVDAGRDGDGERAAGADPSVSPALVARVGDDGAEAVAGGAGTRRADVAEQRALHVLHVAVPMAGAAGDGLGSLAGAGAVAGGAHDGGVDLEVVGDAERRLREVDRQPQQGVLAALGARAGPAGRALAEEGVHDVVEAEALAESVVGAAERVAAAVVDRALLRVGQHLVGDRDLLEAVGRVGRIVDVGMQLASEPAVRPLELVGTGVASDAEQLVVVLGH